MRQKKKNRHQPEADRVYDSEKLAKFINYIMWDGKKNAAEKVVYGALDIVKEKTGVENPLEVFETALKNAGPTLEVRSRRIGGANYQVPREVRPERRMALAFRWIIDAARAKKGLDMDKRLADEIISASKNEGSAVKKKDDTHRMADANKAFAHFAW